MKIITITFLVAPLFACTSAPPMPVIGTSGTGARIELGRGAAINGPITIRADDGHVVYATDGYIAIGR